MNIYEVSFVDGRFIESVIVEADSREVAQELAIELWEDLGIVHGEIRCIRRERALPLLPH